MIRYLLFLLVFIFPFEQNSAQAIRNFDKHTGVNLALMARNGERVTYFENGTPVRIVVKDSFGVSKIVRGFITFVKRDVVEIGSFSKTDTSFFLVATNEIEKVRRLSRRERQLIGWAVGGAIAYSGVVYSILNKPLAPMAYIAFIPAMAVAYVLVYYYPATFLWDAINEKSIKKSWEFSVRNY